MNISRLQRRLYPILFPFSRIYAGIMALRERILARSGFHFRAPCDCISVGNIAWGGTGKTPLTEWIMHWAAGRGIRAVVLTRAYRAHLQQLPTLVGPDHHPDEVGDEPLMLALACPSVPILADPVRSRAARLALCRLQPDVFVLDDGFQHLAMARDMDLVLLRPEDFGEEWNLVIPAGPWREGMAALRRASAFLVKCSPQAMKLLQPQIASRLTCFGKPVFSFYLHPVRLQAVWNDTTLQAQDCRNRPYVLISGVGQPGQVRTTATELMGQEPDEHIVLPDHFRYTARDLQHLVRLSRTVVCTAKDAVKLRQFGPFPDFWYIQTEVRFGPGFMTTRDFPDWLDAWWQHRHPASSTHSRTKL